MTEKTEKKNASWTLLGDQAIITMPSGRTKSFDFTKLNPRLMAYYGAKQWLVDPFGGEKDETEKLRLISERYDEAVEKGLEIAGEGQIKIIGSTRANASGAKQEVAAVKNFAQLLMKKLSGEVLTEDEEKFVTECTEKYKQ